MVLYHVRDVLAGSRNESDPAVEVELRCIVIARNKTKTTLFLTLQDDTGVLQGAFVRDAASEDRWDSAVQMRTGGTVQIVGRTTTQFASARILIEAVTPIDRATVVDDGTDRPISAGSPVAQVYVARLQRLIRTHFETNGYVEIAARIIGSQPTAQPGVYPLRAHYDGYGTPFYIAPSAVPQVLRALTSLPYTALFAVSRCFTQDYRDPAVSVESLLFSAAKRNVSVEAMLLEIDELIRGMLAMPQTLSDKGQDWPATQIVRMGSLDALSEAVVQAPTVQLFSQTEPSMAISVAARLCWPVSPETHADFSEHVLAEGYTAGSPDDPVFSIISVNLDRLLTMIFDRGDFRRIPSLLATA